MLRCMTSFYWNLFFVCEINTIERNCQHGRLEQVVSVGHSQKYCISCGRGSYSMECCSQQITEERGKVSIVDFEMIMPLNLRRSIVCGLVSKLLLIKVHWSPTGRHMRMWHWQLKVFKFQRLVILLVCEKMVYVLYLKQLGNFAKYTNFVE